MAEVASTSDSLWRSTLDSQSPRGFGGLLILVVIARIVSPINWVFQFYGSYQTSLMRTDPALRPRMMPPEMLENAIAYASYEMGVAAAFFVASLVLLWLMFRRKRAFRWGMMAYLFGALAFSISMFWLHLRPMLIKWSVTIRLSMWLIWSVPVVVTLLWISYFAGSQRVKNTFVN